MAVIALEPITMGEEITISYLSDESLLRSRTERMGKLRNWGFECDCSVCGDPVDPVRAFCCQRSDCSGTMHREP